MSSIKMGLNFEGWEELLVKLDEIGGGEAVKNAVTEALIDSKKLATKDIEKLVQKSNLPAKGKYSKGTTINSINRDEEVEWEGGLATIKVGFDFDKSGMTPIFLIKGVPKRNIPAVKGLKSTLYGQIGIKRRGIVQEVLICDAIDEIMRSK